MSARSQRALLCISSSAIQSHLNFEDDFQEKYYILCKNDFTKRWAKVAAMILIHLNITPRVKILRNLQSAVSRQHTPFDECLGELNNLDFANKIYILAF